MGKCSEPTNVRAGGQACPIRYQCAGCPHFESDPAYLPELRGYADDLRRQREAMLAAGAADWATEGVSRQLDVIAGHVLSLIHISEPTRLLSISYAVFCLKHKTLLSISYAVFCLKKKKLLSIKYTVFCY